MPSIHLTRQGQVLRASYLCFLVQCLKMFKFMCLPPIHQSQTSFLFMLIHEPQKFLHTACGAMHGILATGGGLEFHASIKIYSSMGCCQNQRFFNSWVTLSHVITKRATDSSKFVSFLKGNNATDKKALSSLLTPVDHRVFFWLTWLMICDILKQIILSKRSGALFGQSESQFTCETKESAVT